MHPTGNGHTHCVHGPAERDEKIWHCEKSFAFTCWECGWPTKHSTFSSHNTKKKPTISESFNRMFTTSHDEIKTDKFYSAEIHPCNWHFPLPAPPTQLLDKQHIKTAHTSRGPAHTTCNSTGISLHIQRRPFAIPTLPYQKQGVQQIHVLHANKNLHTHTQSSAKGHWHPILYIVHLDSCAFVRTVLKWYLHTVWHMYCKSSCKHNVGPNW